MVKLRFTLEFAFEGTWGGNSAAADARTVLHERWTTTPASRSWRERRCSTSACRSRGSATRWYGDAWPRCAIYERARWSSCSSRCPIKVGLLEIINMSHRYIFGWIGVINVTNTCCSGRGALGLRARGGPARGVPTRGAMLRSSTRPVGAIRHVARPPPQQVYEEETYSAGYEDAAYDAAYDSYENSASYGGSARWVTVKFIYAILGFIFVLGNWFK